MNNKVYEVKLDMKRATSTRGEWVVVEGDNGNKIEITLTDDGAPVNLSNCRALAVFGKPDGTTVEQDTEGNGLTVSGDDHNIITIELYAGSFSPGPMKCEIQVYSGENYGTLITSAQFTFKCRRGIMNSDTVQSVPEYPILLSATAAAEEATAEALAAAATARSSVQSDWTEADAENPRYIQHKPTAFTPSAHASTHANGGADAITPDDIGALPADATPASIGALSGAEIPTNLLINGGFNVNQRAKSGTVTLAAGAYGHDRWKAGASGCTYTFATSENVTTLTISAGSLIQVVEGLNLQSGAVCLSWTGTAQGKIGAGSYSSSGVTGTATGGTNLNIEFNTGTLSKVQLNYGSVALPFVPKRSSEELRGSYRYAVEITTSLLSTFTAIDTNYIDFVFPIPEPLRTTPTISGIVFFIFNTSGVQTGFTFSVLSSAAGTAWIRASKIAHGLTAATLTASTSGVLDAELP